MLPLIPLALSLAPEIGKWLFGDKGEAVAQDVAQAVQTVTGTSDPDGAHAALARDPQLASQLRVQLAQIAAAQDAAQRQAELAELQASLGDVQNARSQTVALAQAHSSVQWGPVVVSVAILAAFATLVWALLTKQLPPGVEAAQQMVLGALVSGFTAVVSYWLGSSSGSARKTELLYSSTPSQTTSGATAQKTN
jgi:hypothetical protein